MVNFFENRDCHILSLPGAALKKFVNKFRIAKHIVRQLICNQNPFVADVPEHGEPLNTDNWPKTVIAVSSDKEEHEILFADTSDFSGKKAALLAHFDPQGVIDPYVLYYAEKLREAGYLVILCTQSAAPAISGASEHFSAIVRRVSAGYDFASWKAAFVAWPSLFSAQEILLANDSVFGPIGSLEHLYNSMRSVNCDFWGLVESNEIRKHLQSYFLILKSKTLSHPAFCDYLKACGTSTKYKDSVRLETNLTGWLSDNNLKGGVRFPLALFSDQSVNPAIFSWDALLESGCFPFVKRRLLNIRYPFVFSFKRLSPLLKKNGYPEDLIVKYAKRLNIKIKNM